MSAKVQNVYYDSERKPWKCEGFWSHPERQDYHKGWSGKYVVLQEYGNFSNPIQMVKVEDFDSLFTSAWPPLKTCKFCGFSRTMPCQTRQKCANLIDYPLEPNEAAE